MKLAFVHIEKAAGMSVHKILKRAFGSKYMVVEPPPLEDGATYIFDSAAYNQIRFLYPRLLGIGGHWIRPYSDLSISIPQLRYWTIVRDPVKRTLSHYQYQIQIMGKQIPFDEWSKDQRFWNFQTRKLCGTEDAAKAIELLSGKSFIGVGILEKFDESMILLDQWLGGHVIPSGNFKDNSAPSDKIKEELMRDPKVLRAIEAMNAEDKKLYAWVCDKLFPSQIKAAEKSNNGNLLDNRQTNRIFLQVLREKISDAKRVLLYKPARRLQGRTN